MVSAILLGLAAALSLVLFWWRGNRLSRPVRIGLGVVLVALLVALLCAAALATALESRLSGRWHALVVILALVTAAAGGNHITTAVFDAVDEREQALTREPVIRDDGTGADGTGADVAADPADPADSLRSAGQVLRGGAWIGILERLAVFASLVARWPEGIAVVLAVKGLGRYPELRTGHRPGLAERFIIGTLVSVLWAALCAYAATGPALS
jgi:hypothetical protein